MQLILVVFAAAAILPHASALICRRGVVLPELNHVDVTNETCQNSLVDPICLAVKGNFSGVTVEYTRCQDRNTCFSMACRDIMEAYGSENSAGILDVLTIESCSPIKCCRANRCNDKEYDSIVTETFIEEKIYIGTDRRATRVNVSETTSTLHTTTINILPDKTTPARQTTPRSTQLIEITPYTPTTEMKQTSTLKKNSSPSPTLRITANPGFSRIAKFSTTETPASTSSSMKNISFLSLFSVTCLVLFYII